jgi:tetraacyldisaccharide 4'-kinase
MPKSEEHSAGSSGIAAAWYQGAWWLYFLAPLCLVYWLVISLRKQFFRWALFSSYRSSLPVIVVGNITLGGTGKSPLVSYLIRSLQARGYHPGIVSRGYGAQIAKTECREVSVDSQASDVGDEPLMLKQMLGCPVFVSPNRKLSVQALEAQGCDVVICDDGLQHYALQRDVEICVFDGARGAGNHWLLPAGPLREPMSALREIDCIVVNGEDRISGSSLPERPLFRMDLQATRIEPLLGGENIPVASLSGQRVNAVAAIGNPERFFTMLESKGLTVVRHAFEDHHHYKPSDLEFSEPLPLVMTEKDAVKCRGLGLSNAWYVPVTACLSDGFMELIVKKI